MNLPVLQDCGPYRARVTVTSCAARWRLSQRDLVMAETYLGCRTCEAGKRNADTEVEPEADSMRECKVCGTRFTPQQFRSYAWACSRTCRSQLMRETKAGRPKKRKGKAA